MKEKLLLNGAVSSDSRTLWEWRNHPKIRGNFFNTAEVPWEEHEEWFSRRLADSRSRIYMCECNGKKIGVIRFEDSKDEISVSVNLNPAFLGKGIGPHLIKTGTEKFFEETRSRKKAVARIREDNIASQKAFKKAGYTLVEEVRGAVVYGYPAKSDRGEK